MSDQTFQPAGAAVPTRLKIDMRQIAQHSHLMTPRPFPALHEALRAYAKTRAGRNPRPRDPGFSVRLATWADIVRKVDDLNHGDHMLLLQAKAHCETCGFTTELQSANRALAKLAAAAFPTDDYGIVSEALRIDREERERDQEARA